MAEPVVIIGGGFAGATTAISLARTAPDIPITIVEARSTLGNGIAYSTSDPDHLVNGPAKAFSINPADPEHLARWLAARRDRRGWPGPADGNFAESFPPRALYGDYVRSELAKARVRHEIDTAIDVTPDLTVILESGRRLSASRVVLATGLFRTGRGFGQSGIADGNRYVVDPWAAGAYSDVKTAQDVAIIGSGLTMLDVLISLEKRGFRGRYFVLSRHGLLVRARNNVDPWPLSSVSTEPPGTTLGILRAVRRDLRTIAAAGDDWQRLVATLRPLVAPLWASLDTTERRRFIRHLRCYWDLAFHRAVPESMAWLERVRDEGRFVHVAGRVHALVSVEDERIAVDWQPRGRDTTDQHIVDIVVNAAGYDADWRHIPHPLVRNLLSRGMVRPHPAGPGIEADPATGGVIGGSGQPSRHLFAVGHPLRGAAWEASSIVEQLASAGVVAQAIGQRAPAVRRNNNNTSPRQAQQGNSV